MQPITPPWLLIAQKELGVSEVGGPEHNDRIVEYHSVTHLNATDDETPWCSSFVNWCVQKAGLEPTYNAMARSWLSWGSKISVPAYGCIAIFRRGRHAWQGHVGFFLGEHNGKVQILGGNQGNKVSIADYKKSDLLGYRWP